MGDWLREVRVGDPVTRDMSGVRTRLTVTAVTEDRIVCGPWEFDHTTGGEVDEFLGWDGRTRTGSVISPAGEHQ